MEKIKFKRYDIVWKNREYCVLMPDDVSDMYVYDFGGEEGTGWIGSRKVIKNLMYAAAILGFNPKNKIIYFPIRRNEPPEFYSWADRCDLILTTHQVQLKRSDWKDIRNAMKYVKEKTYILNFDKQRTKKYFHKMVDPLEYKYSVCEKEYLIEVLEEDTLFQVYSRNQFQIIFLEVCEFLQMNLEQELIETQKKDIVPYTFMGLQRKWFPYRRKKQMGHIPFVDYYDETVVNRAKRLPKVE